MGDEGGARGGGGSGRAKWSDRGRAQMPAYEPPRIKTSVLFRVLNPELYVRANSASLRLGVAGAAVCAGLAGYFWYTNAVGFKRSGAGDVPPEERGAREERPPPAPPARPPPRFPSQE